jgi:hypothetical protein
MELFTKSVEEKNRCVFMFEGTGVITVNKKEFALTSQLLLYSTKLCNQCHDRERN